MTNVMSLDAFGEQTFAPALPPASESRPTCFSPHSRAKTVLTFPCSLGWLVSAFHDKSGENFPLLKRRAAYSRGEQRVVNCEAARDL
jgi:hypothetical protein